MHSGEAANTNFIIFALIRTGSEPVIYSTHGEQAPIIKNLNDLIS
jgi:hypothetical protein